MKEEDEEGFKINNICRLCKEEISFDKNCDHCLLTHRYRGPAYSKCKINVT